MRGRNWLSTLKGREDVLPLAFHVSIDKGDWATALKEYFAHPYNAPTTDTYDLLKTILYKTNISLEPIRHRFEAKVRMNVLAQRRQAEAVEWHVFWEALNRGDSKGISMALVGAKVQSVAQQIGVAEACAVLLHAQGKKWHEKIVDEAPFATVTSNNLVSIAASLGRWDLGLEMLPHLKLNRGDAVSLWHAQYARFSWEIGLAYLTLAPAKLVPHGHIVPSLLERGCGLQLLAERLESKRSLTNLAALTPLIDAALKTEDWAFTRRCVDHLVDIGKIAARAHSVLLHLCAKHGDDVVFRRLREMQISLPALTVELLESVRW